MSIYSVLGDQYITKINTRGLGNAYLLAAELEHMQPAVQPVTEVSDDGYWALVDGNWVPTELQNEAIAKGANPHVGNGNMDVNTIPETPDQVVFYSSPNSGASSYPVLLIGVVLGAVILVVLASVLYVWASSLAEDKIEPSLVGDWTNPSDKLELQSNGDAFESTGTFESWYTVGDDLRFEVEGEEGYYNFRYSLVDDILFLAPYGEDGELNEDDCVIYLQGLDGESQSYYTDRIEQAESDGMVPYWCK